MKSIKSFILAAIAITAGAFASCTDYQDEIDSLDYRVTVLENLVNKTNDNIKALQALIDAQSKGWIITGIVEVDPEIDPEGIGYRVISFGKIDPNTGELSTNPDDKRVVTIHNGLNGKDGVDAQAPDISLRQDPTDGNYYWTLNGEWLLTPKGDRIRANGEDGKDGVDGKDGQDGKDGVDGKDGIDGQDGKDGVDGKDGKDGIDGKDGQDGKDGVDGKDGKDGQDGTAPELDINDNGEWIISIDGGVTWTVIVDSNGNPVKATGNDGKDGQDGKDGVDGKNGKDGVNGKDGNDGADGKDGVDGKDGKDGVDGKDGADGKDGVDGKDGNDAFSFIIDVTIRLDAEGNRYVVFTLYDGTEVRLPLK